MKKGTLFLHLVIVILCWKASEGVNPKEQGADAGKAIIYPSKLGNGPKSPSTKITITQEPQDATVNSGEDVELKCVFSAKPGYCAWNHNGRPFTPDNNHIEATGLEINGDCSILINSVTLEDNGEYICRAPASGSEPGARSRLAQLTILHAPKFPIIEFGENEIPNGESIHVVEGTTTIEVNCTISDGSPAAELEWISDGTSLGSGNAEIRRSTDNPHLRTISSALNLPIEQDTNSSRTNLSCRSRHPTLEEMPYNETYAVIVRPGAVVTVQVFQNKTAGPVIMAYPGEWLTLHCLADGEPPPEYWWQKWVDNFWVNFTSKVETNNSSEYLIFEAEEGKFACVAKNKYNIYDNGVRSEPYVIEFIDDGLSTGAIIGIAFGSVAFVIIIVIIVIICYKKRKLCFKRKVQSARPNSSYGNNPGVAGTRPNETRISAPITNRTGNTGNSTTNSTPESNRSQQAKGAIYATVHPKNQTRTNQSHHDTPERSKFEDPFLKTLEAHYSDMESLSSHKNPIPAKIMKSPSLTSSSSSETSSSSSSLSGTSRPVSIANLGTARPATMANLGTARPTTMANFGTPRPISTVNVGTSRPISTPISIIGRQTPTGSTHNLHYINLDLQDTPVEYALTKGEKIQYAIVKQQSDV